jgi:hypothetical protein
VAGTSGTREDAPTCRRSRGILAPPVFGCTTTNLRCRKRAVAAI